MTQLTVRIEYGHMTRRGDIVLPMRWQENKALAPSTVARIVRVLKNEYHNDNASRATDTVDALGNRVVTASHWNNGFHNVKRVTVFGVVGGDA